MSIKVTQDAITVPLNSDAYDAILVAGLMDVRERTSQAEPTHKDDIAYNALLVAALDVVLSYYGVDHVS